MRLHGQSLLPPYYRAADPIVATSLRNLMDVARGAQLMIRTSRDSRIRAS
jgi:hypothetical protein